MHAELEKNKDGSLKHGCILCEHGSICWYKNGVLHREDGPAVAWEDNHYAAWWQRGVLHRENAPAVQSYEDGHEEWWFKGKLHRVNGPAISNLNNKYKEYYIEGKLHREDGSAVIDGKLKLWFIHGVEYTKEEFNLYLKKKKLNQKLRKNLKQNSDKPKRKI